MKTFQNIKKNTHLSTEKKQEMWSIIIEKIALGENSPEENVRIESAERLALGGTHSNSSSLSPNQKNMVTKIITSVLIVGSIIGTSFAAEQALPGDALYAFKVGVNESVRGAFYIGAEADAKWEIAKIERRAQEKAELEAEARLTTTAKTEIHSRSQSSVEKAEASIAELRSEGESNTATSLNVSLDTAINALIYTDGATDSDTRTDSDVSGDVDVNSESKSDVDVPVLDTLIDVDASGSSSVDVQGRTQGEIDRLRQSGSDTDIELDGNTKNTIDANL